MVCLSAFEGLLETTVATSLGKIGNFFFDDAYWLWFSRVCEFISRILGTVLENLLVAVTF